MHPVGSRRYAVRAKLICIEPSLCSPIAVQNSFAVLGYLQKGRRKWIRSSAAASTPTK
jgi:hypothetical protein